MRNTLNRPFLLAGAALALASAPSHAINKCTDAGGQITFTDAPCPEDTHSEKLTLSSNTTTPATSQPSAAGSARKVDANLATEAELSTLVSPATASQIVGERGKRRFAGWPDLVNRVAGLGAAQPAVFASLRGLTVDGQSLQGAAPDPVRLQQLEALIGGKH